MDVSLDRTVDGCEIVATRRRCAITPADVALRAVDVADVSEFAVLAEVTVEAGGRTADAGVLLAPVNRLPAL